jgi:hypothetical protein
MLEAFQPTAGHNHKAGERGGIEEPRLFPTGGLHSATDALYCLSLCPLLGQAF